jgi:hypothetical protein
VGFFFISLASWRAITALIAAVVTSSRIPSSSSQPSSSSCDLLSLQCQIQIALPRLLRLLDETVLCVCLLRSFQRDR